jgi:hypothetical protein
MVAEKSNGMMVREHSTLPIEQSINDTKWVIRKWTNTLHIKLKIEQHEPHTNRDELMCSGRTSNSCSTSCPLCITAKRQKHLI